jgi:hypothetical protein
MAVEVAEPIGSLTGVDAATSPAGTKRFGGRRFRLLVIGALVLGLGGTAVIYKRSTGRAMHDFESGPVRTDSDTTTAIRAEVGEVVTFGGIVLENFSKRPAVLEAIRVEGSLDPGISLVDVKVAGKDRGVGMVGADHGFPPASIRAEAFRPLAGAIVPPRQEDAEWGVEVLMAFRLNRPGQFGFHHALVDYRVGGKRHRIRVNDGFFVCGGPEYPTCDREAYRKLEND